MESSHISTLSDRPMEPRKPNPLGTAAAALFLGACIWLIAVGHSWEGVILSVVFMVVGAFRRPR
jgi:hypothetical protein